MNRIDAASRAIAEVLRPGHFFAGPPTHLDWEHQEAEHLPWEIFRGQLVQRHLTRQTATLESWNIFLVQEGQRSGEPLLSLKLDRDRGVLYLVRGILCHAWEGYSGGDNVYLSREVERWVRELSSTIDLDAIGDEYMLRTELALAVLRAVAGLSRLPLTSVESPLPGFTLGEVGYFWRGTPPLQHRPLSSWRELLDHHDPAWPQAVRTKWLDFLLRATVVDQVPELAALWIGRTDSAVSTLRLLRAVFNDIALSPWTDFVHKTLDFLRQLEGRGYLTAEQHIDFLGWLLRQLARHLTAYDLTTFHHRGANYPDALLLDAALKELLRLLELHHDLFPGAGAAACLRQRALRLAWLHRRRYEEHPVPDAPTSPGENARVLPSPHVRVPDEQILNLGRRPRRLYHGDPLPGHVGTKGRGVLAQCGRDLLKPEELRELGLAIFIERPLGAGKTPGEPDPSPLLAHEAFSRSLAERACRELARDPLLGITADDVAECCKLLAEEAPPGLPVSVLPADLPRVVSLADASKAALDFVVLRTLPSSVRAFLAWPAVAHALSQRGIQLDPAADWLIVARINPRNEPVVWIGDADGRCFVELDLRSLNRLQSPSRGAKGDHAGGAP
jgi:hypothetical protein